MAMLLDAFDSSSIKKDEKDEDDELSKQLNVIKQKIMEKIVSFKNWILRKTDVHPNKDDASRFSFLKIIYYKNFLYLYI